MNILDNLPEFSIEVWDTTYKGPSETHPKDMFLGRLADGAAEAEPHSKEQVANHYREFLGQLNFCPGGRIAANLGILSRSGTTFHNCYVHCVSEIALQDPDSIPGIYTMLEAQAETLKSEGGYGTNFSWIRPAGSYIKGIDSRTPGSLVFMELWDLSSKVVTSGFEGSVESRKATEKSKIRKGAQMFQLSVWHPDIIDFIRAKQTPGRFTKANMSVAITEGFMEALRANKAWDLVFPQTDHPQYKHEWDGVISHWKYEKNLWQSIPARSIWDEIMSATYNRNEPGVFFADLANKLDPVSYLDQYIQATNPCQPGYASVYTKDGIKTIDDVNEGDLIWSCEGWTPIVQKLSMGKKPIWKYTVLNNSSEEDFLYCTSDHEVFDFDSGNRIPIHHATEIFLSLLPNEPENDYKRAEIIGKDFQGMGEVFSIRVRNASNTYWSSGIKMANCGEIPMPTGVCCLGNLVLTSFIEVKDGKVYFNFDRLGKASRMGVRYLDNILDLSNYPLEVYRKASQKYRRIGQGIIGLGSVHLMLGMKYGSKESQEFTRKLFRIKAENELIASALLGKSKGNFPLFDKDKFFNTYWWKNLQISQDVKEFVENIGCMRNSHRSMVAPTGNTGILCGIASGGIEPVFAKSYVRWAIVPEGEIAKLRESGMEIPDKTKGEFFETAHLRFSNRGDEIILKGTFGDRDYEFDTNRGLVRSQLVEDYGWTFAKNHYTTTELEYLAEQGVFDSADQLTPDDHLSILAIASHYVDHAISKTINVANNISFDDFKGIYEKAYDLNIKGLTTYREGTMTVVLEKEDEQDDYTKIYMSSPATIPTNAKLPDKRVSKLFVIEESSGTKWYVHIDFLDKALTIPIALWVNTNEIYKDENTEIATSLIDNIELLCIKAGVDRSLVNEQSLKYSHQDNVVRMARAIGMALRHKVPVVDIVSVLEKYNKDISTFLYHIRKLLSTFIPDQMETKDLCPSCTHMRLVYESGCKICKNCGYSVC